MSDALHAAIHEARGTSPVLSWAGQRFDLSTGISALGWLEIQAYAEEDIEDSPRAAMALLQFAQECFTDASWPAFREEVRRQKLSNEQLFDLIRDASSLVLGRPTTPSSDSDSGSLSTSRSSTASSGSKAARKKASAA